MSEAYDIFISYTQSDGAIAASLASRLDEAGFRCFLADKSILAATEWDTVLRNALLGADRVMVLLTPRSKDSLWVAVEIGAAWVLGKPLIPALMFVKPEELLEPVRKYQTRTVETVQQIENLVLEIRNSSSRHCDRKLEAALSRGANAFQDTETSECFTTLTSWDRLLKIGPWKLDTDGGFVGEGMYRYILSHNTYGNRPFVIECDLAFLALRPENSVDAVNAGIVLGWSTPKVTRQYFHLTFSGEKLFFERVGFQGGDEYWDFKHLTPKEKEAPFLLETERTYALSIRVETGGLTVSCDGSKVFETAIKPPDSVVGRVGLGPWRSILRCTRFDVRANP